MKPETLVDYARAIVRAELDGRTPLSRFKMRAPWEVARVAKIPRPETESALDYLVIRGLAEQEHADAVTERGCPQRYRWARAVTLTALERFAAGNTLCEAAGCRKKVDGKKRFCSPTCKHRSARSE